MDEFLSPTLKALHVPLGERLVQRGLITRGQLERVLEIQSATGGRLGDILIGEGMAGYLPLYQAVAELEGLPFVDLLREPPQEELLEAAARDDYLSLRVIPWRREGEVTVIALCDITLPVMAWIRSRYGARTRLVITSPRDIAHAVQSRLGALLEEDSRLKLWRMQPRASARQTLMPGQQVMMALVAAAAMTASLCWPGWSALAFLMLCHGAYGVTLLFKAAAFAVGTRKEDNDWQARLATLEPQSLPVYTVLIPMFREASSLPGMLQAMTQMDYPVAKLDIKLVLEADDAETLAAAQALRPSYRFDIIRVPPGKPRTKPKACNYALRFARGEYVTIYDADDHPDPLQLKKAVWMFRQAAEDVVCLQARLNYYNAGDNLLTRFFALEYAVLFDYLLPGLERMGVPMPLGGTSNHFHLARLRALGEWDPYNVTEDADLGVRITASGLKTQMLDSLTLEEAPVALSAWLKQRARWIKGYMQTWLVHMRAPLMLQRTLGWRGFLGFQCFVGLSTFTFLSAPVVWGVAGLWWALAGDMPGWLMDVTLVNLTFYLLSSWVCTLMAARDRPAALKLAALLYPLYLLLHTVASYKALWQLIVNPHYWDKTRHGISQRARMTATHGA